MNKNGKYTIVFAVVVACVLLTSIAVAGPKGGGGGPKPECRDRIDNDGDGYTDRKDDGCNGKKDNDESNCGDGTCEGSESSDNCVADCGPSTYCGDGTCDADEDCSSCSSDCGNCYQNNCTDSDSGYVVGTKGYTYGMYEGESYDYADYCDSVYLIEYYCSGTDVRQGVFNCNGNDTISCVNGACI
jgi:hypothetical protein